LINFWNIWMSLTYNHKTKNSRQIVKSVHTAKLPFMTVWLCNHGRLIKVTKSICVLSAIRAISAGWLNQDLKIKRLPGISWVQSAVAKHSSIMAHLQLIIRIRSQEVVAQINLMVKETQQIKVHLLLTKGMKKQIRNLPRNKRLKLTYVFNVTRRYLRMLLIISNVRSAPKFITVVAITHHSTLT